MWQMQVSAGFCCLLIGASGITPSVDRLQIGSDASQRILRREPSHSSPPKASIAETKGKVAASTKCNTEPDVVGGSFENPCAVGQIAGVEQCGREPFTEPLMCTAGTSCFAGTWEVTGEVFKVPTAASAACTATTPASPDTGVKCVTLGTHEYKDVEINANAGTGAIFAGLKPGAVVEQPVACHSVSEAKCGNDVETKPDPSADWNTGGQIISGCHYYKLSLFAGTLPFNVAPPDTETSAVAIDQAKNQHGLLDVRLQGAHSLKAAAGGLAQCTNEATSDLGTNVVESADAPDFCEPLIEAFSAYEFIYYATSDNPLGPGTVTVELANKGPENRESPTPGPIIGVEEVAIDKCDRNFYPSPICPDLPMSEWFEKFGNGLTEEGTFDMKEMNTFWNTETHSEDAKPQLQCGESLHHQFFVRSGLHDAENFGDLAKIKAQMSHPEWREC